MLIQICDRCEARIPYPNPSVADREYDLYKRHERFKSLDKAKEVCLCDKCYSELMMWLIKPVNDLLFSTEKVDDDFIFWEEAAVSFINREINQAGGVCALSRKIGVNKSVISKIKNGKYIPDIDFFNEHFPDSGLENWKVKKVIYRVLTEDN